jgi:sulfate permease, SulP family
MTPWPPILGWLPRYQRRWLSGDVFGAFMAWAIVVPESIAYAGIAGVPPQNAFYAAPVALIAYAVFGTSRHLVVAATSATAIMSAATVAAASGNPESAAVFSAALAVFAGLILVVAGLLRLGFVANFLAEPVLVGFLFGLALIVIIRQLGQLLGLSSGDGNFFKRLGHLVGNLGEASTTTLAVGGTALVALLALETYAKRLPAALVVVVIAIAVSTGLNLEDHGVDMVGKIPSAVPSFAVPDVGWSDLGKMAGGAFGLALIAFAESYGISARLAAKKGYDVDPHQELMAIGTANAAAGLFRGFAVSGSALRATAVEAAGGHSPLASLAAAGGVLVTAAFLTPLFTDLPLAVLGAIVIVAVRGFLRVDELLRYARLQPVALVAAVTALLGVLLFDVLPGLLIAVALSLAMFVGSTSAPRVTAWRPGNRRGLLVVRPDGQLYFANANRIRGDTKALAGSEEATHVVVLDLSGCFRLGVAVADTLRDLQGELERDGKALWLAELNPKVARMVARSGLAEAVGLNCVHATVTGAVAAYDAMLRPSPSRGDPARQ